MIEKKDKKYTLTPYHLFKLYDCKISKIITPSIIQKTKSLKTGIKFYKNTRFWGIV